MQRAAKAEGFETLVALSVVKALFAPTNAPTQSHVHEALHSALNTDPVKWDYIDYLTGLTTDNKPSQAEIDQVFEKAVLHSKWDLAKRLCAFPDNAPSTDAVGKALQGAGWREGRFPLEMVKYLCETSTNKPTQTDISTVLIAILQSTQKAFTKKWEYINYLCALTSDSKPDQGAIDKVLISAVSLGKKELVDALCKLEGTNAPGLDAKGAALKNAASAEGFTPSVPLDVVKALFASTPALTQTHVHEALQSALKTNPIKWDYISYLSGLTTDNKPSQAVIESVFENAISYSKWDLAKRLCGLPDNAPGREALDKALPRAASAKKQEFVQRLCELGAPGQEAIDNALNNAAVAKSLEIIKYLCELKEKGPTQGAIEKALQTSINADPFDSAAFDIVKYFCNANDKTVVSNALLFALNRKSLNWPCINYFSGLTTSNKLNQAAIDKTLITAARHGKSNLVRQLCELKEGNAPSQDAINQALEAASQALSLEMVQYLCELKDKAPGQTAIVNSLRAIAAYNKLEDISKRSYQFTDNDKKVFLEFKALLNDESQVSFALKKLAEIQKIMECHQLAQASKFSQLQCTNIAQAQRNLEIINQYKSIESFSQNEIEQLGNNRLYKVLFLLLNNGIELTAEQMTDKDIALDKMAVVIDQLDNFIRNYQATDPLEMDELKRFQASSFLLLLTKDSLEVKKKNLIDLAKMQFSHRDFLSRLIKDVLQCITGAFLIIMPIRYLWGKHPFFTKEEAGCEMKVKEILSTMVVEEEGLQSLPYEQALVC